MNAPATTAIFWKRISTSHNISEGDYQVVQMSGGWEGLEWGERERERERLQKWHRKWQLGVV